MAHKAAGAGEHGLDLRGGMSLLQIGQHLHHRDGTQAGGGKGAVAPGSFGAVNHLAFGVSGDGNAAVNVADDEIAFFIGFSHGFCVDCPNALLVQHMGLGTAVQPRNAGRAGIVAQLVHIGGIDGVHFSAVLPAQLIGQHHPQLCRVIAAAYPGGGVGNQGFINFHDPRFLGIGAAAPPHEGIHVLHGKAVFLHKILNDGTAQGNLVVDRGIAQQLRGIVKNALGVNVFFVFKIAHLGGGGAGVDDQHLECFFHGDSPFGAESALFCLLPVYAIARGIATPPGRRTIA